MYSILTNFRYADADLSTFKRVSPTLINKTREKDPKFTMKTLTFDGYNGQLLKKSEANSFEPFDFFYQLDYTLVGDVENKHYYITGNVTTINPIICMDYVTETNVSINKSILRLTGVLIILGSISFVTSLRQLVNKEKRNEKGCKFIRKRL